MIQKLDVSKSLSSFYPYVSPELSRVFASTLYKVIPLATVMFLGILAFTKLFSRASPATLSPDTAIKDKPSQDLIPAGISKPLPAGVSEALPSELGPLSRLSMDVAVYLFSFLGRKDLLNLVLVSKELKNLAF